MTFVTRAAASTMLLTATIAAAIGTASPAAAATTSLNYVSAGVACHPASGALAAKFNRNLNYLTNVGTTDAYVVCHFQMADSPTLVAAFGGLYVHLQGSAAGSTVTCVAQVGAFFSGTNQINGSVARTHTTSAHNESLVLSWLSGLERDDFADVVTLNCKLPPGMKMGLIQRWEE